MIVQFFIKFLFCGLFECGWVDFNERLPETTNESNLTQLRLSSLTIHYNHSTTQQYYMKYLLYMNT